MDTIVIILIFILLLINGYLVLQLRKKGENQEDDKAFSLIMQQMNEMQKTMDSRLGESHKMMSDSVSDQFMRSQQLIQNVSDTMSKHLQDVTKGVTQANEAGKQIFDLADQLKNLERVLTHQKQRGSLGEASLELILSNILPPGAYKMQYQFPNGDKVDAIINTKDGIIPVDAKFSLDNYTRLSDEDNAERKLVLERDFRNDLKKRIDETSKYIRTEEGTLPFAFMFIPAEGIYYDLLVNEIGSVKGSTRNLIQYAYNDKKVIIVSPTTFAAYLQSVLYGFKAFQIEESVHEIRKNIGELQKHLKNYEEYHSKLGNTIGTVVNHYNSSRNEFKKIDKDIFRITGSSNDLEPIQLDRPNTE